MYTNTVVQEVDPTLVTSLVEKVAAFIESTDPDVAKAELRIADIAIDSRVLMDDYGQVLRDELCPRFKEKLYYVSVRDYTGRNGKRFLDVLIEMKRGLLI